MSESIKDKVKSISTRTFTVGSCPETIYERFTKFCDQNAKNIRYYKDDNGKMHEKTETIYHIGLRILLDAFEADAKSVMLFEKIQNNEQRITMLENQQKKQPSKIKTFGGNKNE